MVVQNSYKISCHRGGCGYPVEGVAKVPQGCHMVPHGGCGNENRMNREFPVVATGPQGIHYKKESTVSKSYKQGVSSSYRQEIGGQVILEGGIGNRGEKGCGLWQKGLTTIYTGVSYE